jgi:hypothetical protein
MGGGAGGPAQEKGGHETLRPGEAGHPTGFPSYSPSSCLKGQCTGVERPESGSRRQTLVRASDF